MHPPLCCERVEILMGEYLEQDLPRPLLTQVYSHLRACVECWTSLQRMRDTVTYLSAVLPLRPPAATRYRLATAVRARIATPY